MEMASMKVKLILTRDKWRVRLFRVMWQRGVVGDGKGYSCAFSVGLYPRVACWRREPRDEWRLWLCGIRFHFERSFGGVHV